MPILNEDLTFDQLAPDVRKAFANSKATKVFLPQGTSLYRFSGHANISPWWAETDRQLARMLLSAKEHGQNLVQYNVRRNFAVLRKWDPSMHNLIITKLNRPVYAFSGKTSLQDESASYRNPQDLNNYKKKFTKPVIFRGGNDQVYIQGLTRQDTTVVIPAGTINIYDDVDAIMDLLITYKII